MKLAKTTLFIYSICNPALERKRALYIQNIAGQIVRLNIVPRVPEYINSL